MKILEAFKVAEAGQLAIRANADDVRPASEWLERVCAENDVPEKQIFRLDQCLNEVLANIVFHGGPSAQDAPVLMELQVNTDGACRQAYLSVSDTGIAFNPQMALSRQHAETLVDATAGGLGLSMIESYSDGLAYDFRENRNHLTVFVQWEASK